MDTVNRGQRGGLFSIPLGLTVGDPSTYYQRDRKNENEVGLKRSFANHRGKTTTTDTFNKLVSNAIGDPYQDSGKYFLRSESGKKAHAGPFNPSGRGNRMLGPIELTQEKEFKEHFARSPIKTYKWLATKTHTSSFAKTPYTEDAYERKEDMRRLDYKRRA